MSVITFPSWPWYGHLYHSPIFNALCSLYKPLRTFLRVFIEIHDGKSLFILKLNLCLLEEDGQLRGRFFCYAIINMSLVSWLHSVFLPACLACFHLSNVYRMITVVVTCVYGNRLCLEWMGVFSFSRSCSLSLQRQLHFDLTKFRMYNSTIDITV